MCVCGTDCFSGIECCCCVLALTACFHAKYRTAPHPRMHCNINRTLACWAVKDCQPCMPVLLTENLKESIHLSFYISFYHSIYQCLTFYHSILLSIDLFFLSFYPSFYHFILLSFIQSFLSFCPSFHSSFLSFYHQIHFYLLHSVILPFRFIHLSVLLSIVLSCSLSFFFFYLLLYPCFSFYPSVILSFFLSLFVYFHVVQTIFILLSIIF